MKTFAFIFEYFAKLFTYDASIHKYFTIQYLFLVCKQRGHYVRSAVQCHSIILVSLYILHKNYILKHNEQNQYLDHRPQLAMVNIVQKMNAFVND